MGRCVPGHAALQVCVRLTSVLCARDRVCLPVTMSVSAGVRMHAHICTCQPVSVCVSVGGYAAASVCGHEYFHDGRVCAHVMCGEAVCGCDCWPL